MYIQTCQCMLTVIGGFHFVTNLVLFLPDTKLCFRLYADLLSVHMKTVGMYCQLSHKTVGMYCQLSHKTVGMYCQLSHKTVGMYCQLSHKTVGMCCQLSHKTHKYAVWAELAFLNVTFSDHWASKDLKRSSLQITVIKK